MSTKHFSISIPELCIENWEEMTPCEKGRFCGSCQKTVIDFTTWSDAELAAFFVREESKGVCGYLLSRPKAVDATVDVQEQTIQMVRLMMAFSLAVLTVISAPVANAQEQIIRQMCTQAPPPFPILRRDSSEASAPIKDSTVKSTTLTKEEIEKMPVRDMASLVTHTGRGCLGTEKREDALNINGGRAKITLIIIDGSLQKPPKKNVFQRISAWFRKTF